jgi:hypothetical protein
MTRPPQFGTAKRSGGATLCSNTSIADRQFHQKTAFFSSLLEHILQITTPARRTPRAYRLPSERREAQSF